MTTETSLQAATDALTQAATDFAKAWARLPTDGTQDSSQAFDATKEPLYAAIKVMLAYAKVQGAHAGGGLTATQ